MVLEPDITKHYGTTATYYLLLIRKLPASGIGKGDSVVELEFYVLAVVVGGTKCF